MNTERTYSVEKKHTWQSRVLQSRVLQSRVLQSKAFMRLQAVLLLGVLLILSSCEDGGSIFDPPPQNIPTGEYRGQYTLLRSNPSDTSIRRGVYTEVSMAFVVNSTTRTYRITPTDTSFLPASEGAYTLRYGRITLRDRSQRTFRDPSLVLNGEFIYTFDGNSLVLSQKDSVRRREYGLIMMRVF